MLFPSNRASQQLLPECEGVYVSESRQAVYGGSSPGPQLEEPEEKKSTEMQTTPATTWRNFVLSLFSENSVFLMPKIFHESTNIFDLNKSPASQSSPPRFCIKVF